MSELTEKILDLRRGCDGKSNYQFCWECEPMADRVAGELLAALDAHDAATREQAKAELFDQLYAAAGTEAMDAYRATHPGLLTVLDVVEAIREQAQREQMEADCTAACISCMSPRMTEVVFTNGQWWHKHNNGSLLICDADDIRADWAKAHPEGRR